MKRTEFAILLSALLLWAVPSLVHAQHAKIGADVFSFFDNSEGDDSYRDALTHAGIRITPFLSVSTDDSIHSITGGYSFLYDYGERKLGRSDVELYYQYKHDKLRVLFGCFPRTKMREKMPEYLICDSINYYRPEINGFDFLYTIDNGFVEAFCDWTQLRSYEEREQFMAGLMAHFRLNDWFQLGIDGHLYHYALEYGNKNQFIHEAATSHPYIGVLFNDEKRDFHYDFRAGMLFQIDRDRQEGKWHSPFGFVADADVRLKRFVINETFYCGKSQQFFGNQGFGKYYWGDTFLQSNWYSRTDLGYNITSHDNASLDTKLVFNVTNRGLQWHQMLTLRCNIDFLLK